MNHCSISCIGEEIYATYDDGKHKIVIRQRPTEDFIFDCACALDTIAIKIAEIDKKEK